MNTSRPTIPSRFARLRPWRWLLLVPVLVSGCLQLQRDEEKEGLAEQQVMARHDELMARMDELYTLRMQLNKLPDTLTAARRTRALRAADDAMMQWMRQYHKPADTVAHERVLAYFAVQQRRIDSVGVLMQHSIDSARVVLKPQPAPAGSSSR